MKLTTSAKWIAVLLLFLLGITSCTDSQINQAEIIKQETVNQKQLRPTLTIVVDDHSKSAKHLSVPLSNLKKIWYQDALNGGSQVISLGIQKNSIQQEPWLGSFLKIELTAESGNVYRKSKVKKNNAISKNQLEQDLIRLQDSLITKVNQRPVLMKSDVNGALYLVKQLADAYANRGYRIRVLIFSDLDNDTALAKETVGVELPSGIVLALIGTKPEIDPAVVFPNQQVLQLPVFDYRLFIKK